MIFVLFIIDDEKIFKLYYWVESDIKSSLFTKNRTFYLQFQNSWKWVYPSIYFILFYFMLFYIFNLDSN